MRTRCEQILETVEKCGPTFRYARVPVTLRKDAEGEKVEVGEGPALPLTDALAERIAKITAELSAREIPCVQWSLRIAPDVPVSAVGAASDLFSVLSLQFDRSLQLEWK